MNRRISLIHQEGALKSYFPKSKIIRDGENEIIWVGDVIPSPLSALYKLKIHFHEKEGVKVYVVKPNPLKLAENKNALPHVYSTKKQRLCLFYPKDKEWNTGMFYVKTLIPWACEWLVHYEIWVSSGIWNGGGIHNENTAENSSTNEHESTKEENKRKNEIL